MQGLQNKALFKEACYIGGKWVQADNGKTFAVKNPFDETVLGQVPECGAAETRRGRLPRAGQAERSE